MGITGSYIQDKTDIWNLSYNKRLKNNIDFYLMEVIIMEKMKTKILKYKNILLLHK